MDSVLVIEPSTATRERTIHTLEQAGYRVTCADDSVEGFALAYFNAPSLILVDSSLPMISAWALIQQLQNTNRTAGIPCLLMAADSGSAISQDGGWFGLIRKPIDDHQLLQQISHSIQQSRPG